MVRRDEAKPIENYYLTKVRDLWPEKGRGAATPSHGVPGKRTQARACEEDMEAKVMVCIYTAKVLAGNDHHRLQGLILLLLQHNGLQTIEVLTKVFSAPLL
ncbi:hypothetical protein E2C01_038557 [Portunus trituberculatus]|uniref:Uncharacterized protein n=1 Tax=Portunus trituberculatus TaxID=210409 RepID=A0A5B7FH47_PORTR|nr:hypothetical protein [Portunus trituberculatus]